MAPGVFSRLVSANAGAWSAYVDHGFVRGLADGSLPQAAFRRYLTQDYLFLIHFSRAWALAVFKSDTLADMRERADTLHALLNTEMRLHVEYCARWGIDAATLEAEEEAAETVAYTRAVIDAGLAGDVLDLEVALAPCVLGYGAIGRTIARDATGANPYAEWIRMYAGAEYQDVCRTAEARLDRAFAGRGGEARFAALSRLFGQATRLEAAFWDMGLAAS
jgi:thiaminase/transcriptional activator TenA